MKNAPILQVDGPAPDPPTLPVIRVVLPHTEACDPNTFATTCAGPVHEWPSFA